MSRLLCWDVATSAGKDARRRTSSGWSTRCQNWMKLFCFKAVLLSINSLNICIVSYMDRFPKALNVKTGWFQIDILTSYVTGRFTIQGDEYSVGMFNILFRHVQYFTAFLWIVNLAGEDEYSYMVW